jgi:hypothetical protein
MAGRARRLPKWQAIANAVPNDIKIRRANIMPKNNFFSLIFFSCMDDYILYNQGNERERK